MSAAQGFQRGDAGTRLASRRVLFIAGGALAVIIAVAIGVAALTTPEGPKPICPSKGQCGVPPTTPPLRVDEQFSSSGLGYRLQYANRLWEVKSSSQDSVQLNFKPTDALIIINGAKASDVKPEQALSSVADNFSQKILGMTEDTEVAHEVLGPQLAYRNGVAKVYNGTIDNPQGPGVPVNLVLMSAGDSNTTLVATVITATTNEGRRKAILGAADQVLNTLRLRSDKDPA
jgi:hypothetical protein